MKKDDFLSFKPVGRVLQIADLEQEFRLMARFLTKPLTAEKAKEVCMKSGTHLIKMVSPRVDGNHAVIHVEKEGENPRPTIVPSVNAPDIPYAKLLYRPLEVSGCLSRSVIDHVMNPSAISEEVLNAFARVFGDEVRDTITATLENHAPQIRELSCGEFPVIFIPSPRGGDLQVTPVSPAHAFMGMKEIMPHYFQKQERDGPRVPRGRWHRQAVSSQMQNISGTIGGSRVRFLAEMPSGLDQYQAALYRYVQGGRFPRWNHAHVVEWVLAYADLLDRDIDDTQYSNKNTREGLDNFADRMIRDAQAFIIEAVADARQLAVEMKISDAEMTDPPLPSTVLLRRFWPKNSFDRARRVLGSPHFDYRERQLLKGI